MPDLAYNLGASAQQANETFDPSWMNVELAEKEVTVAPAIEEYVLLRQGPMVDDNLELVASGGVSYINGIDFEEMPEGGWVNLTITPGTVLEATYFYYGEPALTTESGIVAAKQSLGQGGGGGSSGAGYATLLKYGAGG